MQLQEAVLYILQEQSWSLLNPDIQQRHSYVYHVISSQMPLKGIR